MMLKFKPTKEKHGWRKRGCYGNKHINPTTIYGFGPLRRWLRRFDGNKIGHRKLNKVVRDPDDYRIDPRPFPDYDDMRRFFLDNLGKTYQEAWEKFLRIIGPKLPKYRRNTKELEAIFLRFLGEHHRGWGNSRFKLNDEGKIDLNWGNLNNYKSRKIHKKLIREYNGVGYICGDLNKITDLGKRLYTYDPTTEVPSESPQRIFVISEKRWHGRCGKDEYFLRRYSLVVVPGWKVDKGLFLVRKKK